jgi:hypothetical protein
VTRLRASLSLSNGPISRRWVVLASPRQALCPESKAGAWRRIWVKVRLSPALEVPVASCTQWRALVVAALWVRVPWADPGAPPPR